MIGIANISERWGLGRDNQLLFHISADLKRFKALTTGGTVIMGRKTLDSFPGGKALPNRRNIVLTRDKDFLREGVEVAHSLEEVFRLVQNEPAERVWVIGGGEIYRQLLPYCEKCYLTQVQADPDCDTYFHDLSQDPAWCLVDCGEWQQEGELNFRYMEYERKH